MGVFLDLFGLQATNTLRATMTWDAENRLTAWTPLAFVAGAKKLELAYDYLGRRVEKRVLTWDPNTGGGSWVFSYGRRFVWQNWLMVEELDIASGGSINGFVRKYTYGLDLGGQSCGAAQVGPNSGSPQIESAGGIGGLLAAIDWDGTTSSGNDDDWLYTYDGNGDAGQIIDGASATRSPTLLAKYEYDAYGNVTPARAPPPRPTRSDSARSIGTTRAAGVLGISVS